MTELSLWLDEYTDIYSDFDSRHYLKRRISEDFLNELKTALKYKDEKSDVLVLILPKEKRDYKDEILIIESIKNFFTQQLSFYKTKSSKKLQNGIGLLVTGLLIMVTNSFFTMLNKHNFMLTTLKLVLEPAAWFLLWIGFDFLVYHFVDLNKEKRFFKTLSIMNIHFQSS